MQGLERYGYRKEATEFLRRIVDAMYTPGGPTAGENYNPLTGEVTACRDISFGCLISDMVMRNIFGIHVDGGLRVEPLDVVDWFTVEDLRVGDTRYAISWKKGEEAKIRRTV
jgi:hypothetical protein